MPSRWKECYPVTAMVQEHEKIFPFVNPQPKAMPPNELTAPVTQPWMADCEIAMIRRYLKGTSTMLEWGTGGSTLTFAPLVQKYCSIEHNRVWADEIGALLPSNAKLILQEPHWPHQGFAAAEPGQFADYVSAVRQFDELRFDAVLVDGRARVACVQESIHWTTPGAFLFFHDFWHRPRYTRATETILEHYTMVDALTSTTQSLAVFKKRPNHKSPRHNSHNVIDRNQ